MEDFRMIKVNLPEDESTYLSGNGEGVFAEISAEDYEKYAADCYLEVFDATIANDSIYYPGLVCGMKIPIETRGKHRPVVPYEWLAEHYGECQWKRGNTYE